jgi:hypothetical protein
MFHIQPSGQLSSRKVRNEHDFTIPCSRRKSAYMQSRNKTMYFLLVPFISTITILILMIYILQR